MSDEQAIKLERDYGLPYHAAYTLMLDKGRDTFLTELCADTGDDDEDAQNILAFAVKQCLEQSDKTEAKEKARDALEILDFFDVRKLKIDSKQFAPLPTVLNSPFNGHNNLALLNDFGLNWVCASISQELYLSRTDVVRIARQYISERAKARQGNS